jgi:hypothetical protein
MLPASINPTFFVACKSIPQASRIPVFLILFVLTAWLDVLVQTFSSMGITIDVFEDCGCAPVRF